MKGQSNIGVEQLYLGISISKGNLSCVSNHLCFCRIRSLAASSSTQYSVIFNHFRTVVCKQQSITSITSYHPKVKICWISRSFRKNPCTKKAKSSGSSCVCLASASWTVGATALRCFGCNWLQCVDSFSVCWFARLLMMDYEVIPSLSTRWAGMV